MKQILLCLALALPVSAQTYQPTWNSIDSRPTPAWFSDAKFGIFIHWGVYSVPAYAPVIPGKLAYAEWYWHQMTQGRDNPKANPMETGTWAYQQKVYGADYAYQNFAPEFRAQLFDANQWADILAGSGAKYVVLTSKHHEGFALWPSKEASATWGRPWNAVEIGPKRDLLGELSDAVRAKGRAHGHLLFALRVVQPAVAARQAQLRRRPHVSAVQRCGHALQARHHLQRRRMGTALEPMAQPRIAGVAVQRLARKGRRGDQRPLGQRLPAIKHGGYWTTEYTAGMSGMDHPWEESRGMGFSYGYNRAERLEDYHTGRELVLMLTDIVSRGGNLLLDIGPTADGTIPVIMQERLHEIGDWLQVNGEAIYGTRPWKQTRQWSAGEMPQVKYNSEFESAYDVTKLTNKPEAGKGRHRGLLHDQRQRPVRNPHPLARKEAFVMKDVTGVKEATCLAPKQPSNSRLCPGVCGLRCLPFPKACSSTVLGVEGQPLTNIGVHPRRLSPELHPQDECLFRQFLRHHCATHRGNRRLHLHDLVRLFRHPDRLLVRTAIGRDNSTRHVSKVPAGTVMLSAAATVNCSSFTFCDWTSKLRNVAV